jgi:hypothetical protein
LGRLFSFEQAVHALGESSSTMSSAIKKSLVPTVADIPPQTIAAAGNATSGWVDASEASAFIARANLGALGGGIVTLSFEQAQPDGDGVVDAGTAKALTGGGASAVNDANVEVDVDPGALDHKNGFKFFRAKLANVGGTGALCSALIEATGLRYTDQ